jgi:hypothetical protein
MKTKKSDVSSKSEPNLRFAISLATAADKKLKLARKAAKFAKAKFKQTRKALKLTKREARQARKALKAAVKNAKRRKFSRGKSRARPKVPKRAPVTTTATTLPKKGA